jgi:hypothetical protein
MTRGNANFVSLKRHTIPSWYLALLLHPYPQASGSHPVGTVSNDNRTDGFLGFPSPLSNSHEQLHTIAVIIIIIFCSTSILSLILTGSYLEPVSDGHQLPALGTREDKLSLVVILRFVLGSRTEVSQDGKPRGATMPVGIDKLIYLTIGGPPRSSFRPIYLIFVFFLRPTPRLGLSRRRRLLPSLMTLNVTNRWGTAPLSVL